jgi:phosphatidylglycerol:prolipoprotein diacylglycerol transferase
LIPLTIIIDLEPNLFRIGPFLITWHGVFAVLGILAAARLGLWLLGKEGIDVTRGADGVAWMVVLGLIGARLLYVWENYRQFSGNLLRIFAITEGGISQWGGLFGAMVGVYVWSRRAAISFWAIMDAAGPATMIGLAIGRIGDVINGEHHGTPTSAPWGVEYVNADTLGQPGQVVHPEVAYEMILTLVLFGAILPFHQRLKKTLPVGVLGLIYLGLYGVGRYFLSYYRTDPAVFAGLRQAQLASLLMVVIAVIAIPILFQRRASTKPAEVAAALEPMAVVVEPMESAESVAVQPEPIEIPSIEPETVTPAAVIPKRPRKPRRPKPPDPAQSPTDSTNDEEPLA